MEEKAILPEIAINQENKDNKENPENTENQENQENTDNPENPENTETTEEETEHQETLATTVVEPDTSPEIVPHQNKKVKEDLKEDKKEDMTTITVTEAHQDVTTVKKSDTLPETALLNKLKKNAMAATKQDISLETVQMVTEKLLWNVTNVTRLDISLKNAKTE